MAVVGDEVLPGNDVRGRGQRRVHVPGVHGAADGRQAGRLLGAHVGGKVRVARQRRRIGPGHLQLLGGPHRVPLGRRHDADEVAAAQHPRARDVRDRGLVDRQHRRPGAVAALPGREHHAPVQHAGQAHVVHVGVAARHLRRDVDPRDPLPDQLVLAGRFGARRPGQQPGCPVPARHQRLVQVVSLRDRDAERLPAEQLPVGHGLAATGHDARADRQLLGRNAELG